MSIGHLTKQLAQQAIADTLRPAESTVPAEQVDHAAGAVISQVQAIQKALKEDEELLVLCQAAGGTVRVVEIFAASPAVLVLTALDGSKNVVRVVTAANVVQLVCRTVRVQPPAKPAPVRFVVPKGKE